MRHRPDGTFKWIGHYMDHWPNSMALMRKSAAEVALNLQNHVFAALDSSLRQWTRVRNKIIHSQGKITIVNGRPRNPKCQGLVEQGNHMPEKLFGARLHEYDGQDQPTWTEWLV